MPDSATQILDKTASTIEPFPGVVFPTAAADSATSGTLPTGAVIPYAAATAPTGWLLCDGSAVSRTGFAALFALISTTYGVGDGTTTFNVPDLRGRVPVGFAASGGHTDVAALGNNDGSALASRRPKHNQTIHDPSHSHVAGGYSTVGGSGSTGLAAGDRLGTTATNGAGTGITIGPQTGAEPLDAPAYIVLNQIIKT